MRSAGCVRSGDQRFPAVTSPGATVTGGVNVTAVRVGVNFTAGRVGVNFTAGPVRVNLPQDVWE